MPMKYFHHLFLASFQTKTKLVCTLIKSCYLTLHLAGSYTYKFTDTPGITILTASNGHSTTANTASLCAEKCLDYTGFSCKSFDFCGDTRSCLLGKTHILDVPRSTYVRQPDCSHYSRTYASIRCYQH